jgi:hypothetical protein
MVKGGEKSMKHHHFDLDSFVQGLDEEIGEVVATSIVVCKYLLIGSHSIYTWPISFKFMSCCICLSTIYLIFVDRLVLSNQVE